MSRPARVRFWTVLGIFAALLAVLIVRRSRDSSENPLPSPKDALAVLEEYESLQARQYWAPELRAQQLGQILDQLWNRINASNNKLEVLASLQFPLILPRIANLVQQELPHGIRVITPSGGGWRDIIAEHSAAGWELAQCEFRQISFSTNQAGKGVASGYYVSGHLMNPRTGERAIVEGNVTIGWNEQPDLPPIREVDARHVRIRLRRGPPAFEPVLNEAITPPEGSYFIDPLIVWDLDGDGASEILLAARNICYQRGANGAWSARALLDHDPGLIFTAMLGDFTGDGAVDYLCAKFEGLFLSEGSKEGRFAEPLRLVWAAEPRLKYAQVLTAGDVDADGDLDLFLGQYKVPYSKGQMPFPYFEANDGYPSFLLVNDGAGRFSDATSAAGLAAKRARRVYSASLADLDRDADLDLVVVSDFSGVDAYENDGQGKFKDITGRKFDETHGLGMAHAFADFNRDGLLDFLMIGMNSPTADRLASLGLDRPYDTPDARMRQRVTYGNRLLMGEPDGTLKHTALSGEVARTGWSWGAAAQDFDNDGYPDLYIANGHETRALVQEYEPEFWLHDIYVGNSRENSLAHAYFQQKYARTRGRGYSYGGYEKNRFFLNLGGTNFVETAFLFGLALEQDSRNVAADDLNGDGKLDLIVTTFEVWPETKQTLRVFENRLPDTGHWVSHSFKPAPGFFGARVEVEGAGAHVLATGDSYRTQQPLKIHVGLGNATNSPALRVHAIGSPAIDRGAGQAD